MIDLMQANKNGANREKEREWDGDDDDDDGATNQNFASYTMQANR